MQRFQSIALLIFIFCISSLTVNAQIGGLGSFEFLNLPANSRQLALGSTNISSAGEDISMFFSNPALMNDKMNKQVSLTYMGYYADIGQTTISYGAKWGKNSFWRAGLQYVGYGDLMSYDDTGAELGTVQASDYAFVVSAAHQVKVFTLGANLKFVHSGIAGFNSSALMLDLGGAFVHPTKDLVVGLTFKNIGFPLSHYTGEKEYSMPFDMQAGVSFKPERMPVRLSVTYHHLQQFDIAYDDPVKKGQKDVFGKEITQEVGFSDKLSRHFIIGGEFVLGKAINIRMGYNFLRRREMIIEGRRGLSGFSFGGSLKIRKFYFEYSRAMYHVAGGINSFTISANTSSLFTKKKTVIN